MYAMHIFNSLKVMKLDILAEGNLSAMRVGINLRRIQK